MIRFSSLAFPATAAVLFLAQISYSAAADTEAIDISLSDTVRAALENNLGLKLREQDVVISEGTALEAEASFDALFAADITATDTNSTPISIATAGEERTAGWNASISKRFSPGTEVDVSWQNGNLDTDSESYLFDPVSTLPLPLALPSHCSGEGVKRCRELC